MSRRQTWEDVYKLKDMLFCLDIKMDYCMLIVKNVYICKSGKGDFLFGNKYIDQFSGINHTYRRKIMGKV